MMKRRKFISPLGGAIAAWSRARAQQPEKIARIGVISGLSETDAEFQSRFAAFRQSLSDRAETLPASHRSITESVPNGWS